MRALPSFYRRGRGVVLLGFTIASGPTSAQDASLFDFAGHPTLMWIDPDDPGDSGAVRVLANSLLCMRCASHAAFFFLFDLLNCASGLKLLLVTGFLLLPRLQLLIETQIVLAHPSIARK